MKMCLKYCSQGQSYHKSSITDKRHFQQWLRKVTLAHMAVHHLVHFRGLSSDLTAALTVLLSQSCNRAAFLRPGGFDGCVTKTHKTAQQRVQPQMWVRRTCGMIVALNSIYNDFHSIEFCVWLFLRVASFASPYLVLSIEMNKITYLYSVFKKDLNIS